MWRSGEINQGHQFPSHDADNLYGQLNNKVYSFVNEPPLGLIQKFVLRTQMRAAGD